MTCKRFASGLPSLTSFWLGKACEKIEKSVLCKESNKYITKLLHEGPERFFLDFKRLFLVVFKIQFCKAVFLESKSIKIIKFGSVIRKI